MTAKSRSVNAYQSARLSDLVEYGQRYLTPDALDKRIDEVLTDYYEFLGASIFQFRNAAFWAYHKKRLAECRQDFSYARLAVAVLAKSADLVLNPKQTVEKALKRVPRAQAS